MSNVLDVKKRRGREMWLQDCSSPNGTLRSVVMNLNQTSHFGFTSAAFCSTSEKDCFFKTWFSGFFRNLCITTCDVHHPFVTPVSPYVKEHFWDSYILLRILSKWLGIFILFNICTSHNNRLPHGSAYIPPPVDWEDVEPLVFSFLARQLFRLAQVRVGKLFSSHTKREYSSCSSKNFLASTFRQPGKSLARE